MDEMEFPVPLSVVRAPLHPLGLDEWNERYGGREHGHSELVRGRAIITPPDGVLDSAAVSALMVLLAKVVDRRRWRTLPGAGLLVQGDPEATLRVPDVMVVRADIDPDGWYAHPHQVALAAEVVSPLSVERDWVTKREEYAAVGIPNYLVVDLCFDEGPRLWLFDRLQPGAAGASEAGEPGQLGDAGGAGQPGDAGEATTYPSYAELTGDGTSVTIRIPGCEPLTITAADLARELA